MTKAQARPSVIEGYRLVRYILENKYPRTAIDVRHPNGKLAFELDEPRLMRLARHPGIVRASLTKDGYIRYAELLCTKSIAHRLLRVLPNDLPARASHNRQDPGRKGWVIRQERSRSGLMGSLTRTWFPPLRIQECAQATAA